MKIKHHGYVGKILRVDLNTGTFTNESTEDYKEWLGGSGVGQWVIYNEVKPWVTPYDPDNRLVIGTGPLSGTIAPTASRITADTKSPVTSGVGSSNAGGHMAAEIKFAGYDHIIVGGKSGKPVYLWIQDGNVKLRDASHIWGKSTWETVELIRSELGDSKIQVLCIGPAGENLVRAASIMVNKNRALGRCGVGAVMGSKNLKAIAVRGTGPVEVADPDKFFQVVDRMHEKYNNSKTTEAYTKYGTIGAVRNRVNFSSIAYKNFLDLNIPQEMVKTFDPDRINEEYKERNISCFACPIACSRIFSIKRGAYAGLKTEGTQFESLVDFGGKLAVNDFSFVIKATALCNQYGLDVDLPAGTIAWAMECYEKGLLTEKQFDGLKPLWGDQRVILELIRKMVYREGVGDILAEGVARAADIMGEETRYYAIHIKGQDLYEPLRFAIGWALGACVSTRGGGHTTGSPTCETSLDLDQKLSKETYGTDTFNQPISYEGKEKLVRYHEMLHRLNNSLGICHFGTKDVTNPGFPEISELYNAATGNALAVEDLQRASLRILNLEKAFNILHAGFDRSDDYPPRRAMEEAIISRAAGGKEFKIEKEKYDALLDKYYDMHGWDRKTSFPTRKCLENLGLQKVADDLERAGRLGSEGISLGWM